MSHSTHAASHDHAGIAALGVKTVGGAQIRSYANCLAFYEKHNPGGLGERAMRLASNVALVWQGYRFAVRLYATDIVFYYPDETFMATLGPLGEDGKPVGATPTTVNRIRQFTPLRNGYEIGYHRHRWKLRGYGAEERVPC